MNITTTKNSMRTIKTILLSLVLAVSLSACDKQQASTEAANAAKTAAAQVTPANIAVNNAVEKTVDAAKTEAKGTAQEKAATAQPAPAKPVTNNATGQYKEGVHYQRLPQEVPVATPGKLEVAEVFWYGCIHCYNFEPVIQGWKKNMPADVEFVAVPAVWNDRLALHAKAYYTAKLLGVLDKVHMPIFNAMNKNKQKLASQAEIEKIFVANGVSSEDFNGMFNSFGVNSLVTMAQSRVKGYATEGTPEVVVNGKYRITAKMAGSYPNIVKVVDFLLEKERKQN